MFGRLSPVGTSGALLRAGLPDVHQGRKVTGAVLVAPTPGRFTRVGIAYGDAVQESAAANVSLVTTKVVVSPSDGEVRKLDGPDAVQMWPQCVDSTRKLYAVKLGNPTPGIYSTLNGTDWTLVLAMSSIVCVWCLDGDVLVAFCSVDKLLRRSGDGGVTWAVVYTPQADTVVYHWTVVNDHGTALFLPYPSGAGDATHTCAVGRATSADGYLAWTTGQNIVCRHIHTAGYHQALRRWVLDTEPFNSDRTVKNWYVSDDDGLTWVAKASEEEIADQPCAFMDYGHASRIMFGSDTSLNVGWVDLTDANFGEHGSFVRNYDNRNASKRFVWALFRDPKGVYYAAINGQATASPRDGALLVSNNLVDWAMYHRCATADYGIQFFAGIAADGKLYGGYTEGDATPCGFRISPAIVRSANALSVEPVGANLMTANGSSAEASNPWLIRGGYSGAMTWKSDALAPHGAKTLRYDLPAGWTSGCIKSEVVTGLTFNLTYTSTLKVRGRCREVKVASRATVGGGGAFNATSLDRYYPLDPVIWTEVVAPYINMGATYTDYQLFITVSEASATDGEKAVANWIEVDEGQVSLASPKQWTLGGETRAVTQFKEYLNLPADWTAIVTFWPRFSLHDLKGVVSTVYFHTFTIRVSDTIYITVFADPADDTRWNCKITDGVHTQTLYTLTQFWMPGSPIQFIVTLQANGKVRFYTVNGSALIESNAESTDAYPLITGEASLMYGDVLGANGMPGHIAICGVWDSLNPATEVLVAINGVDSRTFVAQEFGLV